MKITEVKGTLSKSLVGFYVGDVSYAVPIDAVSEIIQPMEVFRMPRAPEGVEGVIDHRGTVVPIIDLRRRFGLPPSGQPGRSKWVIVKVDGPTKLAGFVVDKVTDVFSGATRREVPRVGTGDPGIDYACSHRNALVFVLDVGVVAEPGQEIDVGSALRALQSEESRNDG